jgi:predicted RNA binding protein YcfA (HicA-like mRNA interferase family)
MKPISGKKFIKILERHGWQLSRIKGSHHVYTKSGCPETISVPIHGR